MAEGDRGRLERCEPARRLPVEPRVDAEQPGWFHHSAHVVEDIAGDQEPIRLPPQDDLARRMTGCVDDPEARPDFVTLAQLADDARPRSRGRGGRRRP